MDANEKVRALDAMYDQFAAMDNQDVPLEKYPQAAVDALARVGWAVVPCALPTEVLGEAAQSGVFDTGNPAHGWDRLIAQTRIGPKVLATPPESAQEVKAVAVPEQMVVPYGSASGAKDYEYGYEKGVADGWNKCRAAMLAASPEPPTATYRDAYEGAREDLLDWKGRAQRAEARLRSMGWAGIDASEPPAKPAAQEGVELQRYGLQWNGPKEFVATPMPDGYWTPWHIAADVIRRLAQPDTQKGVLYRHLLDMLGAKDHADAGRIIGELHGLAQPVGEVDEASKGRQE